MSVDRFDPVVRHDGCSFYDESCIDKREDGDYVLFADYEKLSAELATAKGAIENLKKQREDWEKYRAKLITDGKMLDWLDENLISLYHQGPYMDGCNIGGQLRNPGPSAGSYFRVHHRKIRIALQEAMNQAGSI